MSSAIVAIGKGGRKAEWSIEDASGPLVGDQSVYLTVLAPKIADELHMPGCLATALEQRWTSGGSPINAVTG